MKCPQCEKDWSMSLREEKSGAFGLKLLIHDCGFKIYERRYREIVMDMLNKNKEAEQDELWINHGSVGHSHADRLDCIDCINVEIEFLQEIKKSGGKTKFIENMEEK